MNELKGRLTEGEAEGKIDHVPLIWSGRPAWSEYFLLWIFVAAIALRSVLMLWIGRWDSAVNHLVGVVLLGALAAFFRQTTRYRITQEAVYRTKGLFGQHERCVPLKEITRVDVRQGPLDRRLNVGVLVMHLKNGAVDQLTGVPNPEEVRRKLAAFL